MENKCYLNNDPETGVYIKWDNDEGNEFCELFVKANHIQSVNSMYAVGKGGRKFMNPECKKAKNQISGQVALLDPKAKLNWLGPDVKIRLDLCFIITQSYLSRDLDNMQKFSIDALFGDCLDLNDSHITELHAKKMLRSIPRGEHESTDEYKWRLYNIGEFIVFRISPSKENIFI